MPIPLFVLAEESKKNLTKASGACQQHTQIQQSHHSYSSFPIHFKEYNSLILVLYIL